MDKCICCHQTYEMERYDFYHLCRPCFNEFDNQKMQGRFSFGQINYFESDKDFVDTKLCQHGEQTNLIKDFIKCFERP
jgi:hypothetical protein